MLFTNTVHFFITGEMEELESSVYRLHEENTQLRATYKVKDIIVYSTHWHNVYSDPINNV